MPLLQRRIQYWGVGFLGHLLVNCLAATWRFKSVFPPGVYRNIVSGRQKVIVVFWHRHLLSLLGRFKGHRVCVPVSEHTDGEYVAQVMERCGLLAVRGSTTRGHLKMIRGLLDAIENGRNCGISPDGPRGPCYSVQPGFILLARRTGLPVVPIGVGVRDAWEANSWDSFVIPKPFSPIAFYGASPISAEQLDELSLEDACAYVKEELMQATRKATDLAYA